MVRGYQYNQSFQNGGDSYDAVNFRPRNRSFQRGRNNYRRGRGNRRNFDFDRSRGFGQNNSDFPTQRIINKADYSTNTRNNTMPQYRSANNNIRGQRGGSFRANQGQNNRMFSKGRFNRNQRNNTQIKTPSDNFGGNMYQDGNGNTGRRPFNKRGNFRGGRRGGRFRGRTRDTKESLDAQLDNYMGDDAVKSRLDLDLYNYFSGNNTENKEAGVDYEEDVPMDGTI